MTAESARRRARDEYPELASVVGGEHVDGSVRVPVVDPATEEVLGHVPFIGRPDLERAIAGACDAFGAWSRTPATERQRVLLDATARMRASAARIAATITLELGKPVDQALAEVDLAARIIEWNASEALHANERVLGGDGHRIVVHEPVGPVFAVAGWNAPLLTPARKISAALAAGCPVVVKPSELTPGTALHLAEVLRGAGLPDHALQVVFGDAEVVAETALADRRIRLVTFTGSVEAGRRVAERAGRALVRSVLELGGHAPVIVLDDVDVDDLAPAAVSAAYRNAGQVCTSPTRFLLHQSIYHPFVERFVASARSLDVGDGFDRVDMGPVAHSGRLEWMTRLVQDARDRSIVIAAGGSRLERPGYFWSPTVLVDPTSTSLAATEEPFGPVAVLTPVPDTDTAIDIANALRVGLAGYVFGNDGRRVRDITARLDCGAIAVNQWSVSSPDSPFGGRRDSGQGVEGGPEGFALFRQTKYIGGAVMSMPADERRSLEHYPWHTDVAARFTDNDVFGHLNNVAIAQYFEEARARLSQEIFGLATLRGETDTALMVAAIRLQYLGPASWPTQLRVGVGVSEIGHSSWTCAYGLFAGGSCIALSEATLVHTVGGAATPLPADERAVIEQLRLVSGPIDGASDGRGDREDAQRAQA